ncbi:MAG: hypothetical protein IPK83_03625 [Planctomycetes bacterium]|nr:hypothetical protein [Planctomycetota bacterium]
MFARIWPSWLIEISQAVRHFCERVKSTNVYGIPLDWPFRFVFIGFLFFLLQLRLARRRAAYIAALLVISKELYDVYIHQDLFHPGTPDWGDVADIASGLGGLFAAMFITRNIRQSVAERPAECGPLEPPGNQSQAQPDVTRHHDATGNR